MGFGQSTGEKNGKKAWSQENVLEEMSEWRGGLNGEAWKCYSESQRGGALGKMRIPGQESSRERMQKWLLGAPPLPRTRSLSHMG